MQHLFRSSLMALAFGAVATVPASAYDAPGSGAQVSPASNTGQPASKGDEAKGQEGPDTEDMFGFTVGTDVLEKGHYEVSTEAVSGFGKRFGHYQADALRSTFTFAPIDGFSIELGTIGNHLSIRNVPGLDNRSFTSFGGLSAEFKWQLLKRDPSPFGLTLLAEPHIGFLEEDTGERGRTQGLETRLLLDTALIPNTLFAGFNTIYEMDKFRPRGVRLFSREGEELDVPLAPCVTRPPKVNAAITGLESGGEEAGAGTEVATADESQEQCTAFARRKSAERSSRFGFSG